MQSRVVKISKKLFDLIDENGVKLTAKGNLPQKIMVELTGKKTNEDRVLDVRLTKELLLFSNLLEKKGNKIYVVKKIKNDEELFNILLNAFFNVEFVFEYANGIMIAFIPGFINSLIYLFQNKKKVSIEDIFNVIFTYKTENPIVVESSISFFDIFECFFIHMGLVKKEKTLYKVTELFDMFPKLKQIKLPVITNKEDFKKFENVDIVKGFIDAIKDAVLRVEYVNKPIDEEIKYKFAIISFIEEMLAEQSEEILKKEYNIITSAFIDYEKNFNAKKFSYIFSELEEIFTTLGEPSNSVKESFNIFVSIYFDIVNSSKKEAKKKKKDFFMFLVMLFMEIYGYYNMGMFED